MAITLVFPTPVGVFPSRAIWARIANRLPHARGGVSADTVFALMVDLSSPRPWGCFRKVLGRVVRHTVFPTPVGVFLSAICASTSD